jgi:pyruvate dehydrogenase E2 component (dihydrolipoamide acetyltransferase)
VGFAVALPAGLPVPVIAHADELGLAAIARQRKALVERAQSGKLRPEDLESGTFTISNLGMYGVDAFYAIINAPQVAILSVGALVDRIVPRNGLPAVVPTLTLGLSCDHRVVDGARGAEFLATIAELIANSTSF